MTEKLKQKTKELLESKPKELGDAIYSFDWGKECEKIGNENNFISENEHNELQIEVMLVLVGLTSVLNLPARIENNISISRETAEKITKSVAEKILNPIAQKITDQIKANIKDKKPTWQQNINFVISGGDYTVFLKTENPKNNLQEKPTPEQTPMNYSKIEDLKNNFTI